MNTVDTRHPSRVPNLVNTYRIFSPNGAQNSSLLATHYPSVDSAKKALANEDPGQYFIYQFVAEIRVSRAENVVTET